MARKDRTAVRVRGTRRLTPLHAVGDLTPDPHNANRGTPRGRALLGQSLSFRKAITTTTSTPSRNSS